MSLNKFAVIKKRYDKDQWAVFSEKGDKKLSKWYSSKNKAKERLKEIEYFKSQDQENDMLDAIDLVDQTTNKDVLTMKPSDYQFKYSSIKKESFGLPIAGQNEGLDNPNFDEEELYFKFFSGKDVDQNNPEGVSQMNSSKKIEELIKKFKDDPELESEAQVLKDLLKKTSNFGTLNMSWLDYLRGFPVVSEMTSGRGMDITESYYNSFSSSGEASTALIEEYNSVIKQDEDRALAAFIYLLHRGNTCSTRVKHFGQDIGSLLDIINSIFSFGDYIIGGLLVGAGGLLGHSAFKDSGISLKRISKGLGSAALIGSGAVKIADTFSYRDLIPLLCRDANSFSFVDGKLVYGKPEVEIAEEPYEEVYEESYVEPKEEFNLMDTMIARQPSSNNYNTQETEYKQDNTYKTPRQKRREHRRNRFRKGFGRRRR